MSKIITDISKKIKLRDSIAALTLISLANGAPDIMSSFMACEKESNI